MDCCYLFTPALRMDSIVKHRAFGCERVVVDLEDSVHPTQKQAARQNLSDFDLSRITDLGISIGIRINSLSSMEGIRDIDLLQGLFARGGFPVDLINVPKVRSADDLQVYKDLIEGFSTRIKVMPLIETIEAVDNIDGIARISDALLFGQADLTAPMYFPNQHFVDYARARLCIAAAKYKIPAVDTNSFEIRDMAVLDSECRSALENGFIAKAVIHPQQVETIRDVFAVTKEKIEAFSNIVNAYDQRKNGFSIDTEQVIAPPFVARARSMLDLYNRQPTTIQPSEPTP